jgi:hypothetical protein
VMSASCFVSDVVAGFGRRPFSYTSQFPVLSKRSTKNEGFLAAGALRFAILDQDAQREWHPAGCFSQSPAGSKLP